MNLCLLSSRMGLGHCRIWTGSQPSKSKYLTDQKRMIA
ncbi:unnamed protein product [Staurois parvus]|uniref:Uncharacterized protein n=1 Tax=Staurois parvus TaxID=386267 RepID=A0ABN9GX15_9NEOB|nr:unnamed protein product [Staurois parvus]